jgi:phosphoglycerate dehydrogenase-like enzyme
VIAAAVEDAGGRLVAAIEDADALVWLGHDPTAFPTALPLGIGWVQLPQAGIERWLRTGVVDDGRLWTSAAGAFGGIVGERAVALLLAGIHRFPEHARGTTWDRMPSSRLPDATVLVVGTGAIGRSVAQGVRALGGTVIGMNRDGRAVPGFARMVGFDAWPHVCTTVDHVVLAAPATERTRGMVGQQAIDLLPDHAVLVNIARGTLVDTTAVTAALAAGRLGAACLDVTDPEPLPDDHPLWREPRALITSHTANPQPRRRELLARHIAANVARWCAGEPLEGVIDPTRGY